MKNKSFTKRTISGIMALAFILTSASCSNTDNGEGNSSNSSDSSGGKTKPVQTADEVLSNAYRSIPLETEEDFSYVNDMVLLSTGDILINGSNTDNEQNLYLTDTEFSELRKLDINFGKPENGELYFNTAVAPDDTIFAVVTAVDYGDFELPDYDDPDFDYENFDYEAMQKAAVYSYKLFTIDGSGNVILENDITGLEKYKSEAVDEDDVSYPVSIGNVYPCGNDKVILTIYSDTDKQVVLGSDGKLIQELDLGDDSWFYNAGTDKDGNLAYVSWGEDGQVIKTIDTEKLELTDKKISLEKASINNIQEVLTGSDEYAFYLSGSAGLYGITEDGTADEFINWIDSDLNGDYINSIVSLDDGDFIIYLRDWNTNEHGFFRITERDASELADTVVVTLGVMYSDQDIMSQVTQFNKSNGEYRIKVEDYSKYDEYDSENEKSINTAAKQLKMDILAGKAPDMIYTYDTSIIESLASKDIFADLYEYLGTNGSISKEEIMPNLLKACEINGKLLSLSPTFVVSTLAAKTKFADKENWTLDDLIETYDNLPEDMQLFRYDTTKESVFNVLLYSCMDFIDYENATCSFDSPEFLKILEFCDKFPEESEQFDWENATDEEMQKYWNEQEVMCRNDKALLDNIYFYDLVRVYSEARYGTFGDEITFVGFPSTDGNGAMLSTNSAFSIMNDAANKDACWSFISQMFTEEYQNGDRVYQIPASIAAFENKLELATQKPFWTDENGKKHEYDNSYYIMDEEIKLDPLTEDEKKFVGDYIRNASGSGSSYINDDISSIINEEIKSYFAGERSAQETADMIQNRASIVISEQS